MTAAIPAVATASATQLLEDEGVNIILGPVTSVTAPAVAEYAVPRGAIMVSGSTGLVPMLTPESVDGDMKTLFNTSGDLAGIAGYMERALETGYPDATKVAALYDDGGIGSFMGPNFSTAAEALGLELVAEEVYPADATDFSSVLTTIKGAEPDVLFVCCTSTANANIAKQAIELGRDAGVHVVGRLAAPGDELGDRRADRAAVGRRQHARHHGGPRGRHQGRSPRR